ncbi:MAG: RNA-binding protein [Archaeoglobus sp.]|nr:RNA-binding protein [Archaeoglobus sp.]
MNIYVGNLPFEAKEDDLRKVFEAYGEVESVNIIKDRFSGKSRGFAFVEMPTEDEAKAAIEAIDGSYLNGREIKVNVARPRTERRRF